MFLCPPPYKFKNSSYKQVLYGDLPIVSSKYRHLYQFCYVKVFSTNHNGNLLLLNYPRRVRSQITRVVCQIQRLDFDCIMVVSRKVIIWTRSPLRITPLYSAEPVRGLARYHVCYGRIYSRGVYIPRVRIGPKSTNFSKHD
jgi:hypothetical protein